MNDTMQALLLSAIGRLELVEQPIPTVKASNEVVIRVRSVGVCGSDLHGYAGHTGRRIPPLVMGHEVAGEVVATGPDAHVAVGTPVATMTVAGCGQCSLCRAGQRSLCNQRRIMGMNAPGGYAEYVKWFGSSLVPLPGGLSFEHGALAEPLAIAIHAVGLAHIQPYDTACIIGAGPIGLLTLAVLRNTAVSRILITDMSDARLAHAKAMGADLTVNPSHQDVNSIVNHFVPGGVDIAFEAVGVTATAQQSLDVTRNKGQVIWIGNNHRMVEINMQTLVTRELRLTGAYGMSEEEFKRGLQMLADGLMPVNTIINRRATLREGTTLFDELLTSPDIIKCIINL